MSDRPLNLLKRFLLVTLPYMNDMISNIYTQRTTKLFTPIIKSFVALKVLIQNERTRWFTARTLRSAFVQGIVRVGYSPLFFYYELLVVAIVIFKLLLKISILVGHKAKLVGHVPQCAPPWLRHCLKL